MLVSIVIPTYNREATIVAAVESALAQTHRNLEVIVVDDGSVDSTLEVLAAYENRISIIRQANAGPSAARNRGVNASRGEVIAFLDSDDQWKPTKIERQVALMKRGGSGMCCCVCNARVMGADGALVGDTFDFAGLRFDFAEGEWTNPQEVLATRFLLFNQVVAVRREAFDRVGGFNEKLRLLEDYELSLRLSSAGTWGVIREPLVMKYNDTNGIGVECMTDRESHARVRAEVISGILGSQYDLGSGARSNLERTLRDLRTESRAVAMMRAGGPPARLAGMMLEFLLRARRAARRRSPSWPAFRGKAICV
ncbi:MAG: glycosyltransferase [Luteolibacter sp.]|jgi:glycosyltransferase involved in cell wall biosynthesis|nr:glycosyltransferase [Luteolibacter sp.]